MRKFLQKLNSQPDPTKDILILDASEEELGKILKQSQRTASFLTFLLIKCNKIKYKTSLARTNF